MKIIYATSAARKRGQTNMLRLMLLSVSEAPRRQRIWMGPCVKVFFPRQCQLYPDRYLSWAHTAHCSSSNRVCAVLRIPPSLLPSDSSSLAGPQSSVCTRSINGIVRKQRGLYILTWMDAWGSFHFGWQGYSVRLFVPRLHSCCVSSSSAPLTSHGG